MREQLLIEGLGVERVPDKLKRGRVTILAARRTQKNRLIVTVDRKDSKKVFAILRGSCYNVKKVRPLGAARVREAVRRSCGLVCGGALALGLVCALETRVLKVEITGSGAYYESEVLALLAEDGIGPLAPAPEKTELLTSRILELPRVSFASLRFEGGVLTVCVEVSDGETAWDRAPMKAPRAGILEELVVLRGTPCAAVGQEVEAGQTLISERVLYGEREERVIVMGYAVLRCPVEGVFAGSEEGAFEAARLAFGEDAELFSEKTEEGWRIYGTARLTIASHIQ